jgi:hypothetical protein
MPIINGRRVSVPPAGVYGEELMREAGNRSGRRTVIKGSGLDFKPIQATKIYKDAELYDKKGNPVKIELIPDRSKGSFGVKRSKFSKQIITEQVYDIATHLFKSGVDFDEDDADWMTVPEYRLPSIWRSIAKTVPLLIVFPTEYPELPPIGFYMKADIPQSANGHLYQAAYHDAWKEPIAHGWKWYCVYIGQGNWQPARVKKPGDWKSGDNLWTYFTLINEVLSSKDD